MFNGYEDYPSYDMGGYGMGSRGGGFNEQYRCYSVAMMQGNERQNVNHGGKIILPQSALAKLASLHIQYPMLFELSRGSQSTHAGVLEFIAEEGRVYLPHWMMKTLTLSEGDLVTVKSAGLPLGNFVKIQPQSVDFLDISDPKAVLENALRNFSTLTVGDNIEISYNDKIYGILVMEIKPPGVGVSIVETDLEVDFAPPVGYQEPTPVPRSRPVMESKLRKEVEQRIATPDSAKKVPFEGQGQRLNGAAGGFKGKSAGKEVVPSPSTPVISKEKIVDVLDKAGAEAPAALNLPIGNLYFGYKYIPPKSEEEKARAAEEVKQEPVFEGAGQTLRPPRKSNTARGSGANSPSPSVSSATSASTRAPTPAAGQPSTSSSEPPKPDAAPFQGKGYTMR
ncbi:ubiquitin fusion degradation protein UFD1-domain-containing protein [Dissophora ornata]|nr:ubiquitin fusion degradation protein [Dissophora ornata]KAI8595462.1 ubiquitin fusion degradation protein UFD1-domain-containing protein [Dissophora ornata]